MQTMQKCKSLFYILFVSMSVVVLVSASNRIFLCLLPNGDSLYCESWESKIKKRCSCVIFLFE